MSEEVCDSRGECGGDFLREEVVILGENMDIFLWDTEVLSEEGELSYGEGFVFFTPEDEGFSAEFTKM